MLQHSDQKELQKKMRYKRGYTYEHIRELLGN